MIQAGRPEALAQAGRQPLVLPEHEARHEGAPLSLETRSDRAGKRRAHSVGGSGQSAATADDPVPLGREHDVSTLVSEVGLLVVPRGLVLRTRAAHAHNGLDEGTLRRRADSSRGARAVTARSASCRHRTFTRTGTRVVNWLVRAGPVTSSVAGAACPTAATSTLRSISSSRTLASHQPPATRPSATSSTRRRRTIAATPTRASAAAASQAAGARAARASESPAQKLPATRCGVGTRMSGLTPSPARVAARGAPARSRGPRRARPPMRRARARSGSRGFAAR